MLIFSFLAYLPFWCLYILADFLYVLAYHIIGYRKKVVWQNLQNSFPEKSEQELKKIQKQFYRHLFEVFVETLKILQLSPKELQKRVQVKNIEIVRKRLEEGKALVILTSHLFNWEWYSLATSLAIEKKYPIFFVYQELSSPFFDKLMLKIRTHFEAKALKMQNILKDVIQDHKSPRVVALLADQSPTGNEKDHWTTFLHQDTAFFTGAEKIALKLKLPVVLGLGVRVKRGHYLLRFEDMYHPTELPDTEITEKYVRLLEKQIQETPSDWLWSHKRWKKKRNF